MAASGADGTVGLYFVLFSGLDKDTCHRHLREAFRKSVENDFVPVWITQEECLKTSPTKQEVFVLQNFTGPVFQHLEKFKCVLLGPRCLIASIEKGKPLPLVCAPMFSDSMRDVQVSVSGYSADEKNALKGKVEKMAGRYTHRLLDSTTHLIVKSVLSDKYEKASTRGMQIYTVDWIDAVWHKCQDEDVHATDSQFDRYKCPPFLDLNVCTSNLNSSQNKRVKEYVNKNGGTFSSTFTGETSVLIVRGSSSEKFKVAKSRNVPCVSIDWLNESVKEGYALPVKRFEIDGTSTSSPAKGNKDIAAFCDEVNMSAIPYGSRSHVDETVMDCTASSTVSFCPPPARTPVKSKSLLSVKTPVKSLPVDDPSEVKYLLQQIDIDEVKAAGSFLDGCRVYLCGWSPDDEDKLRRILKISGAARFTELNDSTSHVLVGKIDKSLIRVLKTLTNRPHVVSMKWLFDSVTQREPASEDLYACFSYEKNTEPPSPLSKKGMDILQRGMMSPEIKKRESKEPVKTDAGCNLLLKKYQEADSSCVSDLSTMGLRPVGSKSNSAIAMPPPVAPICPTLSSNSTVAKDCVTSALSNSSCSDSIGDNVMCFKGLTFVCLDLKGNAAAYVENDLIKAHGGVVVPQSYTGQPDYAVVPLAGSSLSHAASETVTNLWLEDCSRCQKICPIEFFHKPVALDKKNQPLLGCVVAITGYTNSARQFIGELSDLLGAVSQEVFARTDKPPTVDKQAVKASTHLICKTSEPSQKYNAAVKWKCPAVSHEWLLACAARGERVSERPFLFNTDVMLPGDERSNKDAAISNVPQSPQVTTPDTPLHYDPEELKRLLEKPLPTNPFEVKTPNTPLGLSQNPGPEESKRFKRWIDSFPDPKPRKPVPPTNSPTFEELRHQLAMQSAAQMKAARKQNQNTPISSKSSLKSSRNDGTSKTIDNGPPSPNSGRLDMLKKLIEAPNADNDVTHTTKRTPIQVPVSLGPVKSDIHKEASQPYAIMWEDPVNIDNIKKGDGYVSPLKTAHASKMRQKAEGSSSLQRGNGSHEKIPELENNKKRKSSESCDDVPPEKVPNKMDANTDLPSKGKEKENKACRSSESKDFGRALKIPREKRFLFSFVEKKDQLIRIVKELKGFVLEDSSSFQLSATHLVLDHPARSEKILSAIAKGIWILHTSYLFDSCKNGAYLKEERYEFGNPNADHLLKFCGSSTEKALALSGYRWRSTLAASGKTGAFDGMRFVLKISPNKLSAFRRLVAAGSGEVVEEGNARKGDICCVEKVEVDYAYFAKKGVVCVPVMYLNDFLTIDPPPSPQSKALEEYRAFEKQSLRRND